MPGKRKFTFKQIIQNTLKKQPGRRFLYAYHQINDKINRNIWIKAGISIIGLLMIFIGFILLFIPGPGTLFIILGISLLCLISRKFAAFTDTLEKKIRARLQRRTQDTD
jgi:predicted PurR-regulated permease PerM